MSGVFNWSVKQLFLWVSVEYWDKECGEKLGLDAPGCHQEVVIWDKIITRDSPHTDRMKITPESVRHHLRSSQERSPLSSAADIQLLLTLRPLPPQRRECPNPRTPYCHYYYNLKEDRQIEMRDMETTVKVAWSVMPTCGQIWQGGGELEGGAVRKFTLPDTASKPFDFYNVK